MVNGNWTQRPGAARRITLDGSGTPYVTTEDNQIYKWDYTLNNWSKLPGYATDIGVA